jgi:chromosome segregation ATPase
LPQESRRADSVTAELRQVRDTLSSVQDSSSRLSNELSDCKRSLSATLDDLATTQRKAQADAMESSRTIGELQGEARVLSSQLDGTRTLLHASQREVDACRQRLSVVEGERDAVNSELAATRAALLDERGRSDEAARRATAECDGLRQRLAASDSECDAAARRLREVSTELEAAQGFARGAEELLRHATVKAQEAHDRVVALERQHDAERAALQNQITACRTAMERSEAACERQAAAQREQLASAVAEVESLR